MKKKILFSIVAVALFAVAMALNSQRKEKKEFNIKNAEAFFDSGTCCPGGVGTCVIGSYVEKNAFYYNEGACPKDEHTSPAHLS